MNSVIDHQRDEEDFPNMQRDPIRWALEKMGRTIEELIILCARPIPFFIPGGIVHGGPTIIGEQGKEIIVDKNGTVFLSPEQAKKYLTHEGRGIRIDNGKTKPDFKNETI